MNVRGGGGRRDLNGVGSMCNISSLRYSINYNDVPAMAVCDGVTTLRFSRVPLSLSTPMQQFLNQRLPPPTYSVSPFIPELMEPASSLASLSLYLLLRLRILFASLQQNLISASEEP